MLSSVENGAMLIKSLLSARDTLLEELQRLSKAIDRALDLTDFISKMDDINLFDSLDANVGGKNGEVSGKAKPQSGLKVLVYFIQHNVFVFTCKASCHFTQYFIYFLGSYFVPYQGVLN